MSILKDIVPILKKYSLEFVEFIHESDDLYTFIFKTESPIYWKAGQHGIFTIHHVKIKNPVRPFSISSIPEEGHIKISMRIGDTPSEFKKTLLELKPGMKITMRGPIGSLYIRNNKPVLFVAGGIGITPFRALTKNLIQQNNKEKQVCLLYLNNSTNFLYKKELDEFMKQTNITIKYINDKEQLNNEMVTYINNNKNEAEYFLVGSKLMIKSIQNFLKEQGIMKKNILKDTFIGY
jgi:NAD(P)H-flavin reductase